MRFGLFSFILFLFCGHLMMASTLGDSVKFVKRYDPDILKKEKQDVKDFTKLLKTWSSSIKKPNYDFLNSQFIILTEQMEKESNELSLRIANRNRVVYQTHKPKSTQDSIAKADLPVGYNPTIKGQIENISKAEIENKKSESEILSRYGKIIKQEKTIMAKLKNVHEINLETPYTTLQQIQSDLKVFLSAMQDELVLLKNETKSKK